MTDDAPFCLVLLAGVAITGIDPFSIIFTTATVTRLISAAVNLEKVGLASESLARAAGNEYLAVIVDAVC